MSTGDVTLHVLNFRKPRATINADDIRIAMILLVCSFKEHLCEFLITKITFILQISMMNSMMSFHVRGIYGLSAVFTNLEIRDVNGLDVTTYCTGC